MTGQRPTLVAAAAAGVLDELHAVGGQDYIDAARKGDCVLAALRDPQGRFEPLVTSTHLPLWVTISR